MNNELTKIEKIALAALQGLLASGHYTKAAQEDVEGEAEPSLIMSSRGPEWEKDGFKSGWSALAVDDAFKLANKFIEESADEEEFQSIKQGERKQIPAG